MFDGCFPYGFCAHFGSYDLQQLSGTAEATDELKFEFNCQSCYLINNRLSNLENENFFQFTLNDFEPQH